MQASPGHERGPFPDPGFMRSIFTEHGEAVGLAAMEFKTKL
jgi:hypothetical protein